MPELPAAAVVLMLDPAEEHAWRVSMKRLLRRINSRTSQRFASVRHASKAAVLLVPGVLRTGIGEVRPGAGPGEELGVAGAAAMHADGILPSGSSNERG